MTELVTGVTKEVLTKVEVEVKTGVDVVDVKVDESEVNVVVEDEKEVVVAVVESTFVGVSMRRPRKGRETNLSRLRWTSCRYCDLCLSASAQTTVGQWIGTRGLLQPGCERSAGGGVDTINAWSTSCQSKMTSSDGCRWSRNRGILAPWDV
jgi:hypothetical protein